MQYVAFLGGLNVGGHRVKMDELRVRFDAMGFTSVNTFLASGNVIFGADGDNADDIERQIEKDLAEALGYDVPAFVRSAEEVRAIAAHAPFARATRDAQVNASAGKLQVALLRRAPDPDVREQVLSLATDADRLAIAQRELFWLPSGRMSDSELGLVAIYKLLGLATMRTMNTIARIVARYLPAGEP